MWQKGRIEWSEMEQQTQSPKMLDKHPAHSKSPHH